MNKILWLEKDVEEILETLDTSIKELLSPPFRLEELSKFISALIQLAEEMISDPKQEEEKRELVLEIWKFYEKKYDLVKQLDLAIDFRKLFGALIGGVVEKFDDNAISLLIEKVIIPVLCGRIYG